MMWFSNFKHHTVVDGGITRSVGLKMVVMERMAVFMICLQSLLERWAVIVAALVYSVVVEAVAMYQSFKERGLMC